MRNHSYLLLIFPIIAISCKTNSLTAIEERYLLRDSNNDKFYLINLIKENQRTKKLGSDPALFINDSFVTDSFRKLKDIKIKKSDIHSVEILEIEKSVKLYGARGKDGFIRIMTIGTTKPLP